MGILSGLLHGGGHDRLASRAQVRLPAGADCRLVSATISITNGAFYLPHAFGLLRIRQKLDEPTREQPKPFDYKTPDGYEFYLKLGVGERRRTLFQSKIEFWND